MKPVLSGGMPMTLRALIALLPVLLLGACNRGPEPQLAGDPAGEPPAAEQAAPSDEAPAAAEENAQTQVLEESAGLSEETQPDDEPIKLARADGEPDRDWKFQEGKEFDRLVPTQPTVGGPDKIEVAEVFWYGCPHCLHLEPYMQRWAANLPADVRFVRIPATWNPLVKLHAQLYYTEQALVQNGAIENPEAFRAGVFREYHERGNRMASEEAIRAFFERNGVSAEQFDSAWSSFEVAQKLRVAEDLERRYQITGVPTLIVNGKYRTSPSQAGGADPMGRVIEIVNELIEREKLR
ncbi:MAG TPA: thiol:disulfide interchange protein DsbA/DsbL [Woeseiaceae bacterium]